MALTKKKVTATPTARFTGGDVTYVLNDRWNLQYINNYTKGDDSHKINENYLVGNYRLTEYLSAYAGASYVKTDTYNTKKSYGYQVGVRGQVPISERWQGFASIGVGDDVNTYEIGVATTLRRNGTLTSNIAAAASMSTITMTTSAAGRSVWAISLT